MEVPTGLEPMIAELQSAALPTWLRNLFICNAYLLYIHYPIKCNKNFKKNKFFLRFFADDQKSGLNRGKIVMILHFRIKW